MILISLLDQNELFDAIMKGQYEFDEEYWGTISSEGKFDTCRLRECY
jgi:hypothetical protein